MSQLSASFAPRKAGELPPLWIPEPVWRGETVFIIGGGPSVSKQNIDDLRGRRTIAINTSYRVAPWAQYLLFSDDRWWRHHQPKISFAGHIVSASKISRGEKLWGRLDRRKPPGMSDKPGVVTVNWTTYTAAIDLAAQLGARRIVTLGLDNKTDGKKTHHHDPHPFPFVVTNFKNK